ncbi:hypothetical protein TNCV_3510811 [Trichonephila clavipes]|nr:hypothetical protein TNCV_3510811 [Trichonephila clavipes]
MCDAALLRGGVFHRCGITGPVITTMIGPTVEYDNSYSTAITGEAEVRPISHHDPALFHYQRLSFTEILKKHLCRVVDCNALAMTGWVRVLDGMRTSRESRTCHKMVLEKYLGSSSLVIC